MKKKLVVIGDSISLHYEPYLKRYLNEFMEYSIKEGIEKGMRNLDKPQGANHGDSSMVLSFLKTKEKSDLLKADILLLNCGLHDIKTNPDTGEKQIPLKEYRNNLEAIVKIVAELEIKLIWIRTTPCNEEVHNRKGAAFHRFSSDCNEYNNVADQIMSNAGVESIDLHKFTVNLGSAPYCDHVHFYEHIREKQAAFIAGWLISWASIS